MNKIYKVIWSKVRNCYVAVSEIAKRNGKSCTSVNCGAKANRGNAGVGLALALSLSLAGGGAACAEEITVNNPPAISADKSSTDYILSYGTVSTAAGAGTTFTVTGTGKVKSIKSEKSGNVITIQANGEVTGSTGDGGFAFSIKGGVNNNSVTVAGRSEYNVAGGASDSNNVTKNTVTFSGTTRDVYGGYTNSSGTYGSATYNTVSINIGGSASSVYGGTTNGSVGNAEHNTVTIKGTVSYAYGGQSYQGSATYNSVKVDNGIVTSGISGGQVTDFAVTGTTAVSNNTVTIEGSQSQISRPGSYVSNSVYGGRDDRTTGYSTVTNNGVEISGGEFNTYTDIYGAKSVNGSPSNNYVTITGGQVPGSVYGGYTENGSATGNRVSIDTTNGATVGNRVSAAIYGGYVENGSGNAYSNEITLKGHGTYNYIYGGFVKDGTGKAINNKIYMNGYSGSNLKGGRTPDGGGDAITGNQLILQTAGNSAESTQNFETVIITSGVKWLEDGDTVFDAGRLYSKPKLDISGATLIKGASSYGTMTLLNDDRNGSVLSSGVIIKYGTGSNNEVTLGGSASADYVIKSGTSGGSSSDRGVSFTYSRNKEHTISLINSYSSGDYKKVVYSVADKVAGISFGTMTWGTGRNATSTTTTNYDFAGVTSVNASGLTFNFANESDKAKLSKTSGSQLTTDMTLLSNANRLETGKTVTYKNNGSNHTQTIPYSVANGASLSGTLTGTVSTAAGTSSPDKGSIKYTITGMTLDSVNLANWDGTNSAAVPTGWTKKSNGVTVSATGFTVPTDITPGNTRNILTTNTNYYFNDNNISGDYKYKAYDLNNDSSNNVTFLGTQKKGVKEGGTSSRNLVYAVDKKYVTAISLNSGMTWGDSIGRAADSSYRFDNLTSIIVSDSLFSNPEAVSGSRYLVTGATSLTANKVASIAHTQDFTKTMSNNAKLSATLAGTISTAEATKVKYTATGITVNTVDLKNWDKTNAANTPDNWTAKEGGVDVVNTGDAITGLAAGVTKVIMTAPTENYFGTVSSSEAYNNTIFSNDEGDTGVTLSGNHYKGVNVEDTGRTLKYYAETMDTTDITLGSMTWDAGRTAGDLYIFNNVNSITASGLSFGFTNDAQKATLSANSSMTLLSSATGLAANKTVTDANYSQDVSYNAANGTVLTGTLTGTVVTEAGAIKYNASSMTLDTVNLAGWDVSTSSAVPAGWSLKKDGSNAVEATVETANMDATKLSNLPYGSSVPILTATGTAYFDGIKINGANAWNGSGSIVDTDNSGVAIVGTTTGTGVKVDDANKNQIVYQKSKEDITKLTLGGITFAAGTKARTFDNTYDLTAAPIVASDDLFTTESQSLMEAGDTMTLVDATGAIKNASNETLSTFNGGTSKSYQIGFTDTIADPTQSTTTDTIVFAGTHTDTLSQEDDAATSTKKSLLTYTVGDKLVETATLSGQITWAEGVPFYTNGMAPNQKSRNSVFTFDANSKIDISGVDFTATTDPLNKTMTLISGNTINSVAKNVAGTVSNGTPASFGVSFGRVNATLAANASGTAEITASGNLTYTVNGVAIDKIHVTSITNDADTVPTGWTLAKDSSDKVIAKVETDGLVVASPSGLESGETKVIIEAAAGSTAFFKDMSVNGSHAWKVDGSTITSDLDIGGVAITGTQTKGGVKVNEANTNQIIYEESKKKINTLTLGSVTFANDDGTAATVARTFDKTYDVSTATINADDLAFANSGIMETGNSMRIVDASAALPNAITQKRMPVFTAQDKTVNYTDTISGKVITFAGTHTDKLEQDAAQTKLTYTVGDKNVSTATLNGAVNWSDGASYYTNGTDVNQNNVAATYKFDGNTSVVLSGVAFSATSDPLAGSTKSMTLLKGVTGVVATKVSGTPSFAVSLDQTNTKLDASASGSAGVSNSDVTYTVSGVAINKVNIKSVGSTADTVPANWTLAKDNSNNVIATVETDGLSVSDPSGLEPGETKVLIKAADGATNYFNGVAVNGSHAWKVDGSTINSDLDIGGVAITGTQTKGGVKVNEANTNQIIYEKSKKKINTLTLGKVTFKNDDGTASTVARSFDKTYDVSTATINADDLAFTNSDIMETGNSMRIVDASAALPNAITQKRMPVFTAQDKTVNYTDTISGKVITFAGTHTDKLEQDAAQTKLTYTVGDKNVSTATLNGTVNWSDGASYYTNGSDANQNGTKATYKFDGNSAVDISGVAFSATADPLTGTTKSMTLLKGVTGVVATKVSGTPSFAVTLDQTNTKLDASASGSAGVSGSDVTYTVSGVAINKVNIKSVGSTADTVPANWTLASGATVETDDLVVASPSGLEPGGTKVLIKAADGATNYFNGVSVNGNYAWKVDNSTITSELDIGGVAITGTQTKGGVKVNEANTNQIIYEESKKKINTLTLGSVTFANDDGTAATVARTFDKTYDVSTATISADGLAFANSDTMETGNLMRIVDASAAIPNAISNNKLSAFAGQTYEVAFSDTITGKNLTLAGTHTDTLSQDAAQSTLTYTVGDKKVSSATLTGDIAWNDGGTHYTNGSDANQNGTKATYKFDGNSAVDISGVQFNATVDPLGKSMTLLKDVNGVVATKVSGTPSFTVALDQTNTKLDAKATGTSGVSGNDVTFTVSGVTLDKITVKSANGTADKVPASWTMAAGATIETDSMTVPELAAGTHVDILQSDTDGFFAKVAINGANAYGNTQDAFTESDAAKSVTIAGTQDKGVTLNTEKKHLIYKAGTLDVASVTLGLAEWKKGATVFDRSGAGYNYAGVAALGTDSFAVSYASPETVATGDSMTLLQANATLKDMAEQVKKTSYSYTPVTGVTVEANITGKLAASGGAVTFTAAENQAGKLTFTNVDWKDNDALMTRPKNITFSGADVDTAKINFTNITLLDANKQMTLVSDFGDKVGTITGTKYMVGTTSEGEGVASLSGSDLIFTTKTGAGGAAEQTHRTVMATEAGIAALAAGQEYVDSAVEGLGMLTNLSPDGTSTFAAMGGGASRYKTGSHVDTRTWNAVVAVGSKREHKKGTFEWGVFAEYGKGNYTLHSDDGGRGDGDTHYAGGGLLAKWTNKHKVYTEASVRMGRISDSASNMLRDGEGNQYGYNVHANYYGGHIGIGKLFEVKKNRELDVYGKFFYTRRNGVSFNAAGRYDLDAVNSSLLRVGARYGSTDKKWNWYGGLAYEYQFDGESGGMLNGNTPIRAASIKGGSVRGEIGLRMDATETNPWKVDFSIYGYGGKHRGIGGSVNVAYMF